MRLRNFKNFDAAKVANIETKMWTAYYRHNFFSLFILLLKLAHEQFKISYVYALKISYPSALAAIHFRKNRGREDKNYILKKLVKFYKSINDIVFSKFDYKKAGELETEWWFIDRYGQPGERRVALANSMASIYNVEPSSLIEYAENRARAMELQDEAEKNKKEADWPEVNRLLNISFVSLHHTINLSSRVRAIIIENNKVLLIHRVKNGNEYWAFPGGGVEEIDKTLDDALKRECLEELGVMVSVDKLFMEKPSLAPNAIGQIEYFYQCKILSGEVGTGTGPEFSDRDIEKYGTYRVEWLPLSEIKDKNVYPLELRDKLI